MASIDQITVRAAYNSLALATLGTCPTWDGAAKRFLAANCLQLADLDHGALSRATERSAQERIRLEGLYGRNWREDPRARQARNQLVEAERAADDAWHTKFTEPFWQAIRDLALVPAPTIAAAVFKADLIHAEEAWNDSGFDADCMQILTDDLARLTRPIEDQSDWQSLLSAFEDVALATSRMNATSIPAEADAREHYDRESQRLASEQAKALDALLLAPAPDRQALAKKLEIFDAQQVEDGWHTAREIVEQLAADARRLLAEA